MHCLISVVIDRWTAVYEDAQAHKRLLLDAPTATGVHHPPAFRAAGGFLVIVDWDGERVLGGLRLPKPTGFVFDHGRLHVALWDHDEVATLSGSTITNRRRHRWFNHLHTLDVTPRGLLVSSSGTDLLAEVNERGEILWEFFFFENGYSGGRYRLGRSFDRALDYNRRYLPAALTTHPNSALLVDDDTVLATLFSTGELVRIDRRDGKVHVVLDGLKRPHAIRRRAEGGYMLADTEGGAVLLLDRELRVEGRVPVAAPWIQDAVFAEDRLFVIGNRRIALSPLATVADGASGDNQLIELRGAQAVKRLCFGVDDRIYMVEPISALDAEALSRGWQDGAPDMARLHWERV